MYMKLLPDDGNVLEHLYNNLQMVKSFIHNLPAEKLHHRYQKDKWSIKEILVHLIDDERIYSYRALRFARNDHKELNGFDQDDFIKFSGANARGVNNILAEYEAVRRATITLFNGLPDEALTRVGRTNESKASVRALVYHIAGHELHHLNVIKQKYLKK